MIELDKKLFLILNGDAGEVADTLFLFFTSHTIFFIFSIIALVVVLINYNLRYALATAVGIGLGIGICDQICNIIKNTVPKFRPIYTADIQLDTNIVMGYASSSVYGPISAHAATSFVVAVFTLLIVRRRAYSYFAIAMALLISYSRIYLAAHFPLDILSGAVVGTLVGYGMYYILERLSR